MVRPLRAEEACGFLDLLFASPVVHPLAPTSRHLAALREISAMAGGESGLPPRAETAALLRAHGVRELLSPDGGMRRYPFLSVIDPLRDEGESPRRRYRMLRTASRRGR